MQMSTDSLSTLLIPLLILALLALASYVFGRGFRKWRERTWTSTTATIASHTVETYTPAENPDYHCAEVKYSFVVNEKLYSGTISKKISNEAHAEEVFRRYPIGSLISIRYYPRRPDLSEPV
jgi:hypothetical protein